MTGKISRLNILVHVLQEKYPRLACEVALANNRERYVRHPGARAGSALLVKRWQKRDAFCAGGELRESFGR